VVNNLFLLSLEKGINIPDAFEEGDRSMIQASPRRPVRPAWLARALLVALTLFDLLGKDCMSVT